MHATLCMFPMLWKLLVMVGSKDSANGEVYNLGFGKTISILELSQNDANNP